MTESQNSIETLGSNTKVSAQPSVKKNPLLENVIDIVCGSAAGSAGKVIEYPFDTVKVRLQSQPDNMPPQFKGPFDCFRQTFQKEGLTGFYRGISSPIVGAALENASLFLTYNAAQNFIRSYWYSNQLDEDQPLSLATLFLCGSFSGSVTSFLLTPIELVKCRMQIQTLYPTKSIVTSTGSSGSQSVSTSSNSSQTPQASQNSTATRIAARKIHTNIPNTQIYAFKPMTPIEMMVDVYRKEGLSGFWRGQTGTLLREAGGSAAWFGSYEYVNQWFRNFYNRDTNTTLENMLAGACAGVMFNLSLFPADTIKSRMQTEALINGGSASLQSQQGFFQVGKQIYTAGGIKALYRGCGITISRAAPSSAIIFVTYEKLKDAVHTLI